VTIVFGAAALSASHPPLPPRCGDEIFDASSLRLDIPANCRARLATPGVQGDGLWRYQHVLGEFVAVSLCSSTLLLLGVSRLARDARLDARPREA